MENTKAAAIATARFEEAARRAAISYEVRTLNASASGAADRFAHIARRFDLCVVAQPQPEAPVMEDLILESALFESGRPIVAVPYIQKAELTLDRVLVCWDGGRAAARAVNDAMPFLTRAKAVEVLVISGERGKQDEIPGVDIGQHLARHNVKVTVNRIPKGDIDVSDVILSHLADTGADFVVMGGYGHSRLREFVLGGATRGVLQAMTAPTLMSH